MVTRRKVIVKTGCAARPRTGCLARFPQNRPFSALAGGVALFFAALHSFDRFLSRSF